MDNSSREKSAETIVAGLQEPAKGRTITGGISSESHRISERKQKTGDKKLDWPPKNRTESDGWAGVQTQMRMEREIHSGEVEPEWDLLEWILSPDNLNAAYRKVKSNKGSAGIDRMDVEELRDYLVKEKESLLQSLKEGRYRPNPVRRVEIPKANGSKRPLGIPTVVDRMIQQAVGQVLVRLYEPQFSEHSYGFRPGRSAHQALTQCQKYADEGYAYAVDMDLEKFFDTVNHSKLIEIISRTVKDGRVVSLIHKYLNAGVQIGSRFEQTEQGVPQGGPLSPLLGNILLNELDKELHRRGHRFVRYADDFLILCKSKRSAQRVLESITAWIQKKLLLKVNPEKSGAAHISKVKFLGYGFYRTKGKTRLHLHPKSETKLKVKLKELTARSNGWGNDRRKEALKQFIIGWMNYFKLADMRHLLQRTDEWYRRRLRMVIWKQWKRIKTRFANLRKLGVADRKAWEWSNTRKGYWHIANSYILTTTITTDRLRQAGFVFLSECYQTLKSAS